MTMTTVMVMVMVMVEGKFALLSNIFLMISKIAEINIKLRPCFQDCGNGRYIALLLSFFAIVEVFLEWIIKNRGGYLLLIRIFYFLHLKFSAPKGF